MTENYKYFLESIRVIDEQDFNEIIESLPSIDINKVDFSDIYEYADPNEIAQCIIGAILNNWTYAFCENANYSNKSFLLEDIENSNDLEEIKTLFEKFGWSIYNYKDIKEEVEEREKEEKESYEWEEKRCLLVKKLNYMSLEDFNKILKEYDNKK